MVMLESACRGTLGQGWADVHSGDGIEEGGLSELSRAVAGLADE